MINFQRFQRVGVFRFLLFLFLFGTFPIFAESKTTYPLEPFDYGEVTLEAGNLRRQLDETMEAYLRIPNDNLLKGFRDRAGMPTPNGTGLGGFYEQDIFHVFGQILAGCSRLYAATGDERCLKKVNALLEGWGETIAPDGYFYFSGKPNAPHYIYEKMMGGIVDSYIYAGNKKALEYMSRITDWAIKNLDKERIYAYNMGSGNTEWYTLSENLFRAYMITGDEKYLRFAEFWEFTEFWDQFRNGEDIYQRKPFYHAYSHLNTFSGASAAYRVKDDPKYLKTIIAAYDHFREKECLVTGGFGMMERLRDPDGIRELLRMVDHSFEVACCSWAGFKLCKSLISFTGEARYGDWIEELMINAIGSTIPMAYDGRQHHYANYNPNGGTKENFVVGWYCCTGTRPQAIADYANLIWFHDKNDLYMNLFAPSSLTWKGMRITQRTVFPEDDKTSIHFAGKGAQFVFSFRKPGWLKVDPTVTINGQKVTPTLNNGWYALGRKWKNGDRIDITLPMEMEISHLPGGFDYPAALKFGPVAMAFKVPEGGCPVDVLTAPKTRVDGDLLTFHVEGYPNLLLRPYYAFGEGERYFLYLDTQRIQVLPETAIRRNGTWYGGGPELWRSNHAGAFAEVRFEGANIRWRAHKDWLGGVVSVTLDGVDQGKVDLWDVTGTPYVWQKNGLTPGSHVLRITFDGMTNPTDPRYMNYAAFEIEL